MELGFASQIRAPPALGGAMSGGRGAAASRGRAGVSGGGSPTGARRTPLQAALSGLKRRYAFVVAF
eukprot:451274-Alexandrium_andersonii.AAC.1